MSYDRPTVKDVRRIFDQYEELVKEYGLIRPGYNLSLDIGSKTYGRAYRVYEVADRSLWGKKGDASNWDDEYGSGHYEPTIGQNYLGMTAAEACEALIVRKGMIYGMSRAWGIEKTNPILDCGHFPTPTADGSVGTGKAIGPDGATMCYSCADDATRAEIADPAMDRVSLYVSSTSPLHGSLVDDEGTGGHEPDVSTVKVPPPPVETSVVDWAKVHGTHYRWMAALDNYEPTRNYAHGDLWTYPLRSDDELGIVLDGSSQLKDRTKMTVVVDDGETVRPYYVASWNANSADDYVILHPFPTNYNEDGTPKVRPDNGRMVDMSGWMIGPSKLYHLKVSKMKDGK